MSKTVTCDFCKTAKIKNKYDGICSGEGEYIFKIENRAYIAMIIFTDSNGDRMDIDICNDCLKIGGIGKEKTNVKNRDNDD